MTTSEGQRQVLGLGLGRIAEVVSAAHGVEEHVGKVAGIVGLVARMLDAVVLRHNAAERLCRLHHCLLDPCNSVRLLNKMHQRMHRHRILTHVQHVIPSLMAVS